MTLVGARMMNASLDASLQGMNTTIALKASTTTVDATNTAQNNTILLEVGARAMNATLMSEVGARAMNATVMTLVGARMMNGSLDLSLQGMNTTIALKASTTTVDATNTAQNTTIALKALTGNCPEGEYVENTTTSGVQCSAVAASSGGNISAQGATAGYITQFQNGTIINNSIIFQNGTNVGIGTTAPAYPLVVNGTAGGIQLSRWSGPPYILFTSDGVNSGQIRANSNTTIDITESTGVTSYLSVNTSSGNVGIGTNAPAYRLDVLGGVMARQDFSGNSREVLVQATANYGYVKAGAGLFSLILESTYNSGYIQFNTGGANERMRIDSTGNVGIGTTDPDAPLDVLSTAGPQLRLTYTDGSVYSNFTTDVNGDLNVRASGGDVIIMLG
jgi:hypothetical protein